MVTVLVLMSHFVVTNIAWQVLSSSRMSVWFPHTAIRGTAVSPPKCRAAMPLRFEQEQLWALRLTLGVMMAS